MQLQLKQLSFWVLIFYLFFVEFREFALYSSTNFLDFLTDFSSLMLILSSFMTILLYSFSAYLSLFYYRQKSILLVVLIVILSATLPMVIRYCIEEVVYLHLFGFDNYNDRIGWKTYLFDNYFNSIVFTSLGIVYYFNQSSKHEIAQRKELEIQNKRTELAFLRSQMNPHFLFNTLNNIYTLVYQKSDNALVAMDKLTSLLRYALYEPAEKVPIKKEIQCMDDFIQLQLMRYDYEAQWRWTIDENVKGSFIPPFILIPFVENAFKHGDLKNAEQPLIIDLKRTDSFIFFTIKNAVKQRQKDKHGGIGLENIQKRLALIYPEMDLLEIKQEEKRFEVKLKLPV